MNVPPRASEKTTWPSAAKTTAEFKSLSWNFRRNQRTPSSAPGSVSPRTTKMIRMTKSRGVMTELARSIPDLTPRTSTTTHARTTVDVQSSWSPSDVGLNPASGGRTRDASKGMPIRAAASAAP